MSKSFKLGMFKLLDVLVMWVMIFGAPMNVYAASQAQDTSPVLVTDKTDYAPGEVAHFTASNFTAGDYLLRAKGPDANIADWGTVTASDSGGFIADSPQLNAAGSYEVRTYPATWSGDWNETPLASATFTVTAPAPTETSTSAPTTEPTAEPTATAVPTEAATPAPVPGPSIQSDLVDYNPGATVTLTGVNWQSGEVIHLFINDNIGSSWSLASDVSADNSGAFTYQFQLPNWFVAVYGVTALGTLSGSTSTTFTDSQPSSITLSPSSTTINPGDSAVYGVTVVKGGNDNSCVITLSVSAGLPTGAAASFDNPNPFTMTTSNVSKTLTITTTNTGNPSVRTPPGNYTFTVQAARGTGCQGSGNTTTNGTLIVSSPNIATTLSLSAPSPASINFGSSGPVSLSAKLTETSGGAAVANATVNFSVDAISVGTATTNASGVATISTYNPSALAAGSHTVQASFAGQTISSQTYTASTSGTQTLTVNKITPVITFGPVPTPTYLGGNFTVSASTTNTDSSTLTYSYVSGPCALVSGATFSSSGAGTCVVQANGAATTNFNAAFAQQSITITKAAGSVTINNIPANAAFGGSFTPTYTVSGDGTPSVTSSTASVCTVSGNLVNYAGAGTCTLTAHVTAGTNFLAANGTPQNFAIGKAAPIITWSNPANIVYGTALDGTQLNATASVPGTFTYSPAAGAILNAGTNQNLHVDFSPTDATNYSTASKDVKINVTQASSTVSISCPSAAQVYTGSAIEPCTASYSTSDGLSGSLTVTYSNNTNVGTATANASYAGDANHQGSSNSATFAIGKASSAVMVSCPAIAPTYTGSAIEPCTASYSGAGGLSGPLPVIYTDNINVGTASANASYAGDTNHTGSSNSATFAIGKASSVVTVSCPAAAQTYTGSTIKPCTASYSGAGGLTGSLTPAYSNNVNVGTATASASYAGDSNHEDNSNSATFDIKKALSSVAVTCPVAALTYTGSAIEPCTASFSTEDGLSGPLTPTYSNNVNVGTATANASYAGDANHEGSSNSATFAIGKASSVVTVSCPAAAQTYTGSAIEPCTASFSTEDGLSGSLTPSYSNNINVGTATANASYAGDSNHEGNSNSATFNIGQAASTTVVSCAAGPFTYDGSPQQPCTVSVTGAGGLSLNPGPVYADNVNAGTATASYTYAGDANHTSSSDSKSFIIEQATSTTVVSCAVGPFTYDGSAQEPCTVSVTGAGGLSLTPNPVYANNTNAGTAAASYDYAGDANHIGSSDSKNFTILKALSSVEVSCPATPQIYTASAIEPCSASFSTEDKLSGPLTPTYLDNVSVGTATANASYAGDSNHEGSSSFATFEISKALLTVTADHQTKIYGDANPQLTFVYSGFKGADNASLLVTEPTCSTTATQASNVGGYPITCDGGDAHNYAFDYVDNTLDIGKATLTVTADDKSRIYGDPNPAFTATYSGFKNGETLTTSDVSGAPSLTTLADTSSPVPGAYTISTAIGTLASGNYSFVFVDGKLSISKATLTVTADNKSRTYGDPNPIFTASFSGFKNGETLTTSDVSGAPDLSTAANASSPVPGPYAISAAIGTLASGNYSFAFVDGNLAISKATLTVTADDKSKIYGDPNPTFTASYSGFKNGETLVTSDVSGAPSLTTSADASSPVPGPYTISAAIGTLASGNYSFGLVDGNLAITPAPLTITAENKSKIYGDANPTLTAAYSGFKNGDTPASLDTPVSLSTTTTAASSVGAYPIVPSGAADINYAITFVNGTLNVTKAPLTITADNKSKVYGDANPTLTASYSGFVNGDTPASLDTPVSLGTTATAASGVGTYLIVPSGAIAANYSISFVNGTLAVTKAPLTITADNKSKIYGSANPALTASYSGFVNGDTPASLGAPVSLSTTATAASGIGAYPIAVSGATAANYSITFVNGTLTVTKAMLTVTATDKIKVLNASNPVFTFAITGFKNNDTASVVTTQPTCTSTAVTNSPVGSYSITCSGATATNYDFTYVNGTLKVMFATGNACMGDAGHQVLQPINADGSSVWKARNTVPVKFRICDANGVSIGGSTAAVFDTTPTAGVAAPYLYQAISGSTSVVETALSTTPDPQFRWDSTAQQWVFNLNTSNLSPNSTYYYHIYLKDGSTIDFRFGLK